MHKPTLYSLLQWFADGYPTEQKSLAENKISRGFEFVSRGAFDSRRRVENGLEQEK